MQSIQLLATLILVFVSCKKDDTVQVTGQPINLTYPIADTGQSTSYDNFSAIATPVVGEEFFGQDAQYIGHQPAYLDHKDGTVSDLVTGLMWQQDPGDKKTWEETLAELSSFRLAGYTDWRLPTIKELYSLILFSGEDPSGYEGTSTEGLVPFIDTNTFVFAYGDPARGDRLIDAQFLSSTEEIGGSQFGGGHLVYGVNFADGRIKGYPTGPMPGQSEGKGFFVLHVRGNTEYGRNDFTDNGDGTLSDRSTGLMWMQDDSHQGMTWQEALAFSENLTLGGYSDWRLPNAKELQSIVDYTRAPGATQSAAIDPLFQCTGITNENGESDFPYYWTSTTHANWRQGGQNACYVSFGRSEGYFMGSWMDVHGAGAQRSDPKTGDPSVYPYGFGPQGDAIRIYNFVRAVRNID